MSGPGERQALLADRVDELLRQRGIAGYSFAGLVELEAMIAQYRADGGHSDDEDAMTQVLAHGAYLGECIRRLVGGDWEVQPGEPNENVVRLRLGATTFQPQASVQARLAGEGATLPAVLLRAYAEPAVATLRKAGAPGDFSPAGLGALDRVIDALWGNDPRPGQLPTPAEGLQILAFGAYLGETLRRALGGQWRTSDGDPGNPLEAWVELATGRFAPMAAALQRFERGASVRLTERLPSI